MQVNLAWRVGGGGISKVFDWTDKQHIYTVFIRERNTTHMYIITRERETVHMYIITRERETVHMYVITRERETVHMYICVCISLMMIRDMITTLSTHHFHSHSHTFS